ncbi:MAG: hypothetical protein BWZ01_00854 [Deltaproteobacteria bacterium ADurb.BinA179]|jgi:hypothetical protein|nr:MAG: hypothetical protein BWZ01_00854 [Deltaproteobacteria bacterium ADurb.BinA179]
MKVILTGFGLAAAVVAGLIVLVHLSCMGYLNRA